MGVGAQRRGFTLVELLVTVSLFGLLAVLAAPSFSSWIQDAQVRTAAESLQNGLRVAQAEATRRHRQVAFVLTNSAPAAGATAVTAGAAAQVSGKYWVVTVIANPLANKLNNTTATPVDGTDVNTNLMVQSGALGATAPNAQVSVAPQQAAICFNSLGRLTTLNDGTYNCTVPATGTVTYTITNSRFNSARALNVNVSLGGLIRVCDPSKSLSQGSPDACA